MRTTDQISATLLKMHSTNPLTLRETQKCKHANTFSGFGTYSHAWKMINNIWIVYLKEETQVKNEGLEGNSGGLFLSQEQWLLSSHHQFQNNIIASLQREVMFVWVLCVNWPLFRWRHFDLWEKAGQTRCISSIRCPSSPCWELKTYTHVS